MVTYCHFTTPRWFGGLGSWAGKDAVGHFARFATRATEHLGDLLGWVATLNEPNSMTMLELTGAIPMGTSSVPLEMSTGRRMRASAASIRRGIGWV